MTEEESIQHQLREWVAGRPWHNSVRDECCPDFSCCSGTLAAPEVRQAFACASDEDRMGFLALFLGGLLDQIPGGEKVLIATGDEPERAN